MPISVTVLGEPVRGSSLEIVNSISASFSAGNVGTGYGVFQQITSGIAYFKTLIGSTGIILTNNTNDVTVAVDTAYITALVNVGPVGFTINRAMISNGTTGALTVSAVTSTELGYLTGVTSAVQTQLNAKQATITGGATTITSSDLSTNLALKSDGSGKVAVSTVTATELGYLSGVTSLIQNQFNTLTSLLASTITNPTTSDLTVGSAYKIKLNSGNWYLDLNGITSTTSAAIALNTGSISTQTGSVQSGGGFGMYGVSPTLKFKVISLGSWNMNSVDTIVLTHGLPTHTKIRQVDIQIISDTNAVTSLLTYAAGTGAVSYEGAYYINSLYILVSCKTAGTYASSVNYSGSANRGYATIWYEA